MTSTVTTVYTGRNWSRKWSRIEWEISGEIASPIKRHNFWCSVRGEIEDLSSEPSRKVIITTDRWGKITSKEIEGFGKFSENLF